MQIIQNERHLRLNLVKVMRVYNCQSAVRMTYQDKEEDDKH